MVNGASVAAKRKPGRDADFLTWISELVHAHRARLIRVARREGAHGEDAFDCVQDAFLGFLELPQARSLMDDPGGAGRVLSVLTKNIARNARRRHFRARPHVSDAEVVDALEADDASVDELLVLAENHVKLIGCVIQLRKVQRLVVALRLLDDVRGEDVARVLSLKPGHVAVLLHRAKDKLRECMDRGEAAMGGHGGSRSSRR